MRRLVNKNRNCSDIVLTQDETTAVIRHNICEHVHVSVCLFVCLSDHLKEKLWLVSVP